MERRYISKPIVELRSPKGNTDVPQIRGYAALFNVLSEDLGPFKEKIAPGAFDDVLENDVRGLWNHDWDNVLGRTSAGTMRIGVDDTGLWYDIDMPKSAVREMEAVERGDVNQSSFGFWVEPGGDLLEQQKDGTIIRTIIKVAELIDCSPVTFPAYEATMVEARSSAIKNLEKRAIDLGFDINPERGDGSAAAAANTVESSRVILARQKLSILKLRS